MRARPHSAHWPSVRLLPPSRSPLFHGSPRWRITRSGPSEPQPQAPGAAGTPAISVVTSGRSGLCWLSRPGPPCLTCWSGPMGRGAAGRGEVPRGVGGSGFVRPSTREIWRWSRKVTRGRRSGRKTGMCCASPRRARRVADTVHVLKAEMQVCSWGVAGPPPKPEENVGLTELRWLACAHSGGGAGWKPAASSSPALAPRLYHTRTCVRLSPRRLMTFTTSTCKRGSGHGSAYRQTCPPPTLPPRHPVVQHSVATFLPAPHSLLPPGASLSSRHLHILQRSLCSSPFVNHAGCRDRPHAENTGPHLGSPLNRNIRRVVDAD